MKVGIFPPTRLEIGGMVCLGKRDVCEGTFVASEARPKAYSIRGGAYVGISASNPDDNFFVAMLSKVSFATRWHSATAATPLAFYGEMPLTIPPLSPSR